MFFIDVLISLGIALILYHYFVEVFNGFYNLFNIIENVDYFAVFGSNQLVLCIYNGFEDAIVGDNDCVSILDGFVVDVIIFSVFDSGIFRDSIFRANIFFRII